MRRWTGVDRVVDRVAQDVVLVVVTAAATCVVW